MTLSLTGEHLLWRFSQSGTHVCQVLRSGFYLPLSSSLIHVCEWMARALPLRERVRSGQGRMVPPC